MAKGTVAHGSVRYTTECCEPVHRDSLTLCDVDMMNAVECAKRAAGTHRTCVYSENSLMGSQMRAVPGALLLVAFSFIRNNDKFGVSASIGLFTDIDCVIPIRLVRFYFLVAF